MSSEKNSINKEQCEPEPSEKGSMNKEQGEPEPIKYQKDKKISDEMMRK